MSSGSVVPAKTDPAKEIWDVATTLTEEAQNAAIQKCRELKYDTDRGRIPLAETLINLSGARDLLIDAVEKQKLVQIPLKIQLAVLMSVKKVAGALSELREGSDAVLTLEDYVDDLTASIWQYRLQNLSPEVLGLQQKLNQTKILEIRLREAGQAADDFQSSRAQAEESLKEIQEATASVKLIQSEATSTSAKLGEIVSGCESDAQKVKTSLAQTEHEEESAVRHAAGAKSASADLDAILERAKGVQSEAESSRTTSQELAKQLSDLFQSSETKLTGALDSYEARFADLQKETKEHTVKLQEAAKLEVNELVEGNRADLASVLENAGKDLQESKNSLESLRSSTEMKIEEVSADHETRFASGLRGIQEDTASAIEELKSAAQTKSAELDELATSKMAEVDRKSNSAIEQNNSEFRSLVSKLDELEGRIKESIERATGYTLFHSFQRRQLDLAKSKRFWGIALAIAVGVSLCASAGFIYSLQFVKVYNAAFYLKLSISLPLIYAIAFCSVQYARERRLEEEYAFKSSISISLDPYQKLVAGLVDKSKPEELAKYTAFVIDSVARVFTSPTAMVFDELSGQKNSAEKIIKAVGDVIEPLVKTLKK